MRFTLEMRISNLGVRAGRKAFRSEMDDVTSSDLTLVSQPPHDHMPAANHGCATTALRLQSYSYNGHQHGDIARTAADALAVISVSDGLALLQ